MLQIKDLVVHYAKSEAVKCISMEVDESTIVTLIGSNGAGKTTILKAISNLVTPSSGEIWFMGKRIDMISAQDIVRLGIAHIPEGRRLFPTISVLENLMVGAYLRKNKTEIAKDLEQIYGYFPILKARQKQDAGSLSGGEQQMLAIARALMTKPRLLLMDEPSLGLSPILVEEVAKIIKEINQLGIAIILVEQNANLALGLANYAYVLEIGRIALHGKAEDLANDERVKKAYLGTAN